jgi:hypothetical protein
MTSAFVAFERHTTSKGDLFTDADGCQYLKAKAHPLFVNADGSQKVFCNAMEVIQAVQDLNAKGKEPFTGEIILLNVITF